MRQWTPIIKKVLTKLMKCHWLVTFSKVGLAKRILYLWNKHLIKKWHLNIYLIHWKHFCTKTFQDLTRFLMWYLCKLLQSSSLSSRIIKLLQILQYFNNNIRKQGMFFTMIICRFVSPAKRRVLEFEMFSVAFSIRFYY